MLLFQFLFVIQNKYLSSWETFVNTYKCFPIWPISYLSFTNKIFVKLGNISIYTNVSLLDQYLICEWQIRYLSSWETVYTYKCCYSNSYLSWQTIYLSSWETVYTYKCLLLTILYLSFTNKIFVKLGNISMYTNVAIPILICHSK